MVDLPIKPGDQLYKYTLRKKLGQGGFGQVWLANDQAIAKEVAIKVVPASAGNIIGPLNEARIGNRLDHQNLAKVHYADVTRHLSSGLDLVIIVLDFYNQGDISNHLNSRGFLPIEVVKRYTIDILKGLEHLHYLGLYHGDIKPSNILTGDRGQGVLTDYGISCAAVNGGRVAPVDVYIYHNSPEFIEQRQIDARTDVYQVGLTAFRLMNNVYYFEKKFSELGKAEYDFQICSGSLVSNTDYQEFVPRHLKSIINKAMRCSPEERYQTAREMRRALEKFALHGSWTTDGEGNLHGEDSKCLYSYDVKPQRGGMYKFIAYKTPKTSGKKVKMSKYCHTCIDSEKLASVRKRFFQYVVCG
jgi:eukaryotic-like serine/threonine-protein kinase